MAVKWKYIAVLTVFFVLLVILLYIKTELFTSQLKPTIWMYWENKLPNSKRPAYLDLCYETVVKHCSETFNIILLDERTIFDYLPNVRRDLDAKCSIPQKTDYYRYMLLYKYGGIWLDSDIIVLQDLSPLIDKLNIDGYDYVGAGCHSSTGCTPSGYPRPSNWLMASVPNSKLMASCLKKADEVLDTNQSIEDKYFIIGREIIWAEIQLLLKNDSAWKYYHIPSICSERDSEDKKYINSRMISTEDNDPKCSGRQLFVPIYNTAPGFPKWFKDYSRTQILESNLLIGKLFRESLNNGPSSNSS